MGLANKQGLQVGDQKSIITPRVLSSNNFNSTDVFISFTADYSLESYDY